MLHWNSFTSSFLFQNRPQPCILNIHPTSFISYNMCYKLYLKLTCVKFEIRIPLNVTSVSFRCFQVLIQWSLHGNSSTTIPVPSLVIWQDLFILSWFILLFIHSSNQFVNIRPGVLAKILRPWITWRPRSHLWRIEDLGLWRICTGMDPGTKRSRIKQD